MPKTINENQAYRQGERICDNLKHLSNTVKAGRGAFIARLWRKPVGPRTRLDLVARWRFWSVGSGETDKGLCVQSQWELP